MADATKSSRLQNFSFEAAKEELKVVILSLKDENGLSEIEAVSKNLVGNDGEKKTAADQAFRECMKDKTSCGGIESYRMLVNLAVLSAQKGLASTTLPFYMLSDVFETVPLDVCEEFFSYVEERITTWRSDLFFNSGKNHLLRMSNDLVHRLSTSQNTVFCGRIQLFLARLFPLSEKSGLNLMSQFNVENITAYNLTEDQKDGIGDDGMVTDEGEEAGELAQSVPIDYNLYKKFWCLQDFFSNPTICYDLAKWKKFVDCTKEVLNVFSSYKLEHVAQKRKAQAFRELTASDTLDHRYFAKFLTSEKLLDLQLNDSNFRRTVLVQFLLIFHYLTGNVKFRSNTQVLKELQTTWVKEATVKIYELLKETPPDGEKFASLVEHILSREENWNSWKNDGCPSFIKESSKTVSTPQKTARVRKRSLGEVLSSNPKKMDLGSTELTRLWNLCPDNMEACQLETRLFLPTLKDFFAEAIEQVDPEAGIEEEYKVINKSDFGWRALRLLARRSQHFFQPSNTPFKTLPAYLESEVLQLSKDLQTPITDECIVENGSGMSSDIG